MTGIERDNPQLKAVLPKEYARPALDKQRLGQLIDLISNIRVGDAESRAKDVLGRVYEYFLSQFASAEGKKGGEFYTPRCVVRILVEMIEPYKGRVYDPCCGSSGMFVQSEEFIAAHGGKVGDISKGDRHPTLSDRRNIVVIADEAHRSQYDFIDGFARHMRDALAPGPGREPVRQALSRTGTKSCRSIHGALNPVRRKGLCLTHRKVSFGSGFLLLVQITMRNSKEYIGFCCPEKKLYFRIYL